MNFKLVIGGVDLEDHLYIENVNVDQDMDMINVTTIGDFEKKMVSGRVTTRVNLSLVLKNEKDIRVSEDGVIYIGDGRWNRKEN